MNLLKKISKRKRRALPFYLIFLQLNIEIIKYRNNWILKKGLKKMNSVQKFADSFLSKKYRGECIHVDKESGIQVNNTKVEIDTDALLKTYEILRSQTTAPIAVRNIGYLLLISIFNSKNKRTKVRDLSYLIDVSNPTIYIALNQLRQSERCILTDNDIKVKNEFDS